MDSSLQRTRHDTRDMTANARETDIFWVLIHLIPRQERVAALV